MRSKYNTKFSNLTLSINLEPEVYIKDRVEKGWHPMAIFNELAKVAKAHKLPMVDKHTIYNWIKKNNNEE